MSNEGAYETKVMLESINHLVYDALEEAEMHPAFTRKTIVGLKDALYFVKQIQYKYEHVKCPRVGFSDEDYNEMQGADDNRP
jgi:hypothetical protein